MSLTKQQKNIVNPNAKSLNSQSRSGQQYNYNTARAMWVIEGIHDSYINFGDFPKQGKQLINVNFGNNKNTVSAADLLAYAALYPQNAIYNQETKQLEMVSGKDGAAQLRAIISSLLNDSQKDLTNYLSVTTKESLLPKNQDFIDKTVAQALEVNRNEFIKQTVSQLIAIPQKENNQRTLDIRASFGNPSYSLLEGSFGIVDDQNIMPISPEQGNIDIYDWRRNVEGVDSTESLYYNPNDFRLYCVVKVNSRNPSLYDVSSNGYEPNKNIARSNGIKKILRFSQKYTYQNQQDLLNAVDLQDNPIVKFEAYLDPRPSSLWVYAVSIDKSFIDNLQYISSPNKGAKTLSNYEKSQRLSMDKDNTQAKRAVYQVKNLQNTLQNVSDTLRTYRSIMTSESVNFSNIANIRLLDHADRLENFYSSLTSFLEYNDVDIDVDKDIVEFAFSSDMEMLYLVYNGYVYAEGVGSKIFSPPQEQVTISSLSVNFFADFPPATMSYIFNGNIISQKFFGKPKKEWMPWSQFLQEFSYPVFETFPSQLSSQSPTPSPDLPILRADRESLFVTLDKALAESRYVDTRTSRITSKEFYNEVNSAMGSCNTAQSRLLRDSIELFTLLNGKKDARKIIRFTISQIKERIVMDEFAKRNLTMAGQVAEQALEPQRVIQQIESELYQELSCVVDLLGDKLEDEILNPMGVPPNTANMIRQSATAPLSIDFWSTRPKNTSPWALWRKAINKIFKAYLKKLLLGVLRDVLEASLGCGPYGDNPNLKDPFESRSYGLADLNAVVDYGEVDLLPIAKNLGMINKSAVYQTDPDDQNKKIRSLLFQEPTLSQLRQFNEDVSRIVTPDELQMLLEGTASFQLINSINQMVNRGKINERLLRQAFPDPDAQIDPINIARYQESLNLGDTRYASLGIDNSIIEDYFLEIGNQLGPDLVPLIERGRHDIKPIDAYCLRNEPFPPSVMNPGVSYPSAEQVAKQYTTVIEAQKNQIESLCGLLALDLPNIQFKVDDFLSNLPNSEFYNQILDLIAWLSNYLTDLANRAVYGDEDDVSSARSAADQFSSTPFGKSLEQSIPDVFIRSNAATRRGNVSIVGFTSPPNVPAGKFYVTPTPTTRQRGYIRDMGSGGSPRTSEFASSADAKIFQVYGTFYENTGKIFVSDPFGKFYEASSIELAETNTIGRATSFSLRGLRDSQGNITNQQLPRFPFAATARFLTAPFTGPGEATGNTTLKLNPSRKVIANQSEDVYASIAAFYFSSVGRSRLNAYLNALGKYVFVPNADDCITQQDLAIANASIEGISSRLIPFFINVGPLARVYFGWNTPDIISFLTDYVYRKFKLQSKSKGVYGAYLDSMDNIQKVYGVPLSDEPTWKYSPSLNREKFYIDESLSSEQKLKKVIETLLFANLKNIGNTTYGNINQNVFDLESSGGWVDQTIGLWLQRGLTARVPGRGVDNLADSANDAQAQYIESLTGNDQVSAFLAYLPLPLLVSMDIVWLDSCINIVENYHRWDFDTRNRINSSDDALLSAINPNYVFTLNATFDIFPVTLKDPITEEQVTFYSKTGLRNELRRLEREAAYAQEEFGNFSTWFQEDYIPTQQSIRTNVLRITDNLEDISVLYNSDDMQNGRVPGTAVDDGINFFFNSSETYWDTLDALTTFIRTRVNIPFPETNQQLLDGTYTAFRATTGIGQIFRFDNSQFTLDSSDLLNVADYALLDPNKFFSKQVYISKITFGSPEDNAVFPQNLDAPSGVRTVKEAFQEWESAVIIPKLLGVSLFTAEQEATANALQQSINNILQETYSIIDDVSDSYDRIHSQMYQAFAYATGAELSEDQQTRIAELDSAIEWAHLFAGSINDEGESDVLSWANKLPSDIYKELLDVPGKITTSINIINNILSDLD